MLKQRRWFWVALIVLITGWISFWLYRASADFPPSLRLPDEGSIGEMGPIILEFPGSVERSKVEAAWYLEPSVKGRFEWHGRQLWFWPQTGLQPDQVYTLGLRVGWKIDQRGLANQEVRFTINVRAPRLLYLGTPNASPEVYSVTLDGRDVKQLTHTGGQVLEFAASPDGKYIAFSMRNAQGGTDIGLVNRAGQDQRVLSSCGRDSCRYPVWSPNGRWVTFIRMTQAGGETRSAIWSYDFDERRLIQVLDAPNVALSQPTWSPDGNFLAAYDEQAQGIRIVGREGRGNALIPTNVSQRPRWSWDSRRLFFIVENNAGLIPYHEAYVADLENRTTRRLFAGMSQTWDVSIPAESPDGQWLVVGMRILNGPVNKQLWLFPVESLDTATEGVPIMTEVMINAAGYQWEPAGRALVYQQIDLSSSDAQPQIVVWWRDVNQPRVIAKEGAFPAWLP